MARKKKTKVFVSYSRHDEALVRPLAGLLSTATEDAAFLDVEQLRPGDLWEESIIRAINESEVFVLCWCCHSKKSKFVAKEITLALADEDKRLVPVLFCYTKLPPRLSDRQWVDLRMKLAHDCDHPAFIGEISGSSEPERGEPGTLYQGAYPLRRTRADMIADRIRRYFKMLPRKS